MSARLPQRYVRYFWSIIRFYGPLGGVPTDERLLPFATVSIDAGKRG